MKEKNNCRLDWDFLLKAVQSSDFQKSSADSFSGVSTDSRQDVKDKVFFALEGPNFNGHDFLNSAWEKGAKAFVVHQSFKAQPLFKDKKANVIHVPDTLKALQNLAKAWTKHLGTKVIAVTGSNGKTSTCFLSRSLFSKEKVFASQKSYNNSIGVPLSLLDVNCKEAFLIQELGANQPGDMAFLSSLFDPIITAVTMVGPSHLEGLRSIEQVAKEKQDIYLKNPKALWVFNRDNPWTNKMYQELQPSPSKVLSFSSHIESANVSLRFIKEEARSSQIKGHIGPVKSSAEISFSGTAQLENLMCACTLALGAGIDPKTIWSLIPECRLPEGRQEWFHIKDKELSILFDAYNANPSSMDFFLQSCERFSKPEQRLIVLGDMRELGEDSAFYHKQLAGRPALLNSRFVAFIGEHKDLIEEQLKQKGFKGRFEGAQTYSPKFLSALKAELKAGDFLAIKASRKLKLEKLFYDLSNEKLSF